MKLNILLLLTAFLVISGCSKFEIDESSLVEMTECDEGVATTTEPCVALKGNYVYDASYGGRSTVGTDLTTGNGSLTRGIPAGWYDGTTASVNDSDLLSSNIAQGSTIFGVAGDLVGGMAFPLCTLPTSTDSTGKIGGSCKVIGNDDNYVYDNEFGGRTNICVEDTPITQACWLNVSGKYIITDSTSVANCSVEGLINTACVVASNNFWYTQQYGGRTTTCTIPGVNGAACWTNQSNVYIRSQNPCVAGYNGGSCQTNNNDYVYTTEYGGRNVNCSSNNVGSCWFAAAKNVVEANLVAGNIKINETIFGVAGSFTGILTEWGSGMSRATSTTTNVLTYVSETTTYSGASGTALPNYYYAVPKIGSSDDGYVVTGQVTPVNRGTWAGLTCGTSGTMNARKNDCGVVFGAEATWNGKAKGHNGEGSWTLVSRTGNASAGKGREVWLDNSTGLMWSSVVSTGTNWCKASGSSNSSQSDIIAGNYNEDDPNDICDNAFYQVQTSNPISACEDAVGFSSTDSEIDNAGKSGLSRSSSPKVAWRLPSMYDYINANHDGLRFVMPDGGNNNTTGQEWTATVDSTDRLKAWLFDPTTGTRSKDERSFSYAVRCIGR